ncbi:YbjN domain-containing protein [Synechococcus sp. Nb3U1]|uniref:YbjN domain-containing protein n=1 Tax=Synechococcus sp. Nb3U1 TaxID=1914529 RepID=UPI001F38B589|nr:YbjN domain-containing protein [Synechococcus sp. Nb3U1]MCF2971190.1 YbjN domain-containing protein [Synechococcus sp. Nb3U1]
MVYSEPLMSTFDRSPDAFLESQEPIHYAEIVSAVVSSLKEDAAYENHEQGHTWKFTYGTVEVFVHLSGESVEDTLSVWSPVLTLPVAEPAKLMQKLLEKNWSDTLEARFCIWNDQVVLNHYRTLEGITAGEISRAITIVASLADEYDEPLQTEFPKA